MIDFLDFFSSMRIFLCDLRDTVMRCFEGGWTLDERMMFYCDMSRFACKVILGNAWRNLVTSEIEMRMFFWHFSLEAIMYNHLLGLNFSLLL